MVDCGVHQIDLARWWLGSEVVAYAASAPGSTPTKHPTTCTSTGPRKRGPHHRRNQLRLHPHRPDPSPTSLYHLGTVGLIRYDREHKIFEARLQGTFGLPMGRREKLPRHYEAFAAALDHRNPGHLPTGQDGLIATRIARVATDQAIRQRRAPEYLAAIAQTTPPRRPQSRPKK